MVDPFPSCCEAFFDDEPIFTNEGTCYSTRREVIETMASTVSSVRVWLHMNESNLPGTING